MPRFFFNVYDGKDIIDDEGTELPDWQSARLEALRLAGLILKDKAQSIAFGEDWRIEVTDGSGLVLLQLTLQVIEAPVILEQIARNLPSRL